MKPLEIKAEIIRRGFSLTEIADDAGCSVPELSMCISGERLYVRLRRIIAKKLGKKVDDVFSKHHPQPKTRHKSGQLIFHESKKKTISKVGVKLK
jgi:lambda repressor-like predicted transcriptional regulator